MHSYWLTENRYSNNDAEDILSNPSPSGWKCSTVAPRNQPQSMWRYSVTAQLLITVTEGDADGGREGGAKKAVMIVSIHDVWHTGQNILTTVSLFLECTLLAHKTKWHFGSYLFLMDWIICSIRGRQFDPPKRVVECCSLEILRRGGLILFCDYVVSDSFFLLSFYILSF